MRTTLIISLLFLILACNDNSTNNNESNDIPFGEHIGIRRVYQDSSHVTGRVEDLTLEFGYDVETQLVLNENYFLTNTIDTIFGEWNNYILTNRDTLDYKHWLIEIEIYNLNLDSFDITMKYHEYYSQTDESVNNKTRTWGFRCKK